VGVPSPLPFDVDSVADLIRRWRDDPGGTYQSWFLWPERLKNFCSIRRGIEQVVREIEADTFGTTYKGSALETVVGSIAEQRQIFKGADHAFLWKPKLRIPDIYENRPNQLAFARMLETCRCCTTAEQVLRAVDTFTTHQVKGMGPAAANMLYFLHPTLMPPFNTAIVNGYNALTGAKIKLGRWGEYLTMRDGILAINGAYRGLLSNDLGAVAGLLFDVGSGRYCRRHRPTTAPRRGPRGTLSWPRCARTPRRSALTPTPNSRTSLTPRCKAGCVTSGWRWVSACGSPATTAAGPTAGDG